MTDLLHVLPHFDTKPYSHLLPSLDKALITTNDLLTLDPVDIGKRAQLPAADLRKLADGVTRALHCDLGFGEGDANTNSSLSASDAKWGSISTLDEELDAALCGGIRAGYLVEITGERCVTHTGHHRTP
jgi:DNA repair protein RAD57